MISHNHPRYICNIACSCKNAQTQELSIYLNGFSLVWVRTCFLRSLYVVKYFKQPFCLQLKVLPLCSLSWARNLASYLYKVLKAFSHPPCLHSKGFILVCTRMWIFKLYEVKKALPQLGSLHLNLYSPEGLKQLE
jgi:hypothetical protein